MLDASCVQSYRVERVGYQLPTSKSPSCSTLNVLAVFTHHEGLSSVSNHLIGLVGPQPKLNKVASLIEGTESNLPARESVVDHRKSRGRLFVQEHFDRACADIAHNANVMPGKVRQRWRTLQHGDPPAGSTIDDENPI